MAEAAFEPVGFMGPQIFGLPVDRETLFSNHKNVYKKRIEKRQRKLIVKISFLKPFLKRGEQVLLITTGYSPLASMAQYLTGFLFVYLKRSLFVFTNYRVIHIPSTSGYNYKNSIAHVAYAGCQSIVLKGGNLIAQFAGTGKKIEKFKSIAVSERKKIRALLKKRLPTSGTKGQLARRIHLCPRCTHELADGKYRCEKCQLQFKSKLVAAISSIVFPGGGYFYIRQYLLGFIDALLEFALLGFIAYLIIDLRNNIPVSPVHMAMIPLFLYIKIATVVHSTHFINEFIPKHRNIRLRKISG
ncbi:MAG: hypothetical protein JSW26_27715 [Desulfobacterales bacterium]|nr:MAG: hypothetical protein JSW26_27715 [Desulfobacterales bacterium]